MNGVKENIPRLWTKFTLKEKKTVKVAEFKRVFKIHVD